MTEKEKAKSGVLYNAEDETLKKERLCCQKKCRLYNQTEPDELQKRHALISGIVGSIGTDFCIEQPFLCDYGYNIHIGQNFYSNYNLVILDAADVKIGDNVFIAPDCGIYTSGHPLDAKERNLGLEYARPVTIGNNVWIGGGVKIMPSVTIGDNCVIGAGSVVTKDIPAGVLAAGNPCVIIRKI